MTLILTVRCPFCGFSQETTTVNRVLCLACGRRYRVFPHGKRSRIVRIMAGDWNQLQRARRRT
jgi:hypothetical protein